ncbi:MAG: mechanosensitive ion channel family protein [Mycobacteriales bacterium]|nr:mechanosensitive ion channel family protein [Mycobacteriales bacterium]
MRAVDISIDGSEALATAGRILLVVVLALVLRAVVHRAISRLVRQATEQQVPGVLRQASPLLSERRAQRAGTIGSALRSVSSIVVFAIATTTILSELGVDLGPVLASAGIVGVAVGFGAQNVIKDWLNGMFMILEDQYGVGDVIDVGPASGTVEAVSLRTTRLRSVDGTVWHVRNGEVLRVGNMSQGWSRALLDIPVTWASDVAQVREVIKAVADDLWQDDDWSAKVLEEPEVWGVESMGSDGLVIRLVVKTPPLENWDVARELRQRIKAAFEQAGIDIGVPTRAVRTVEPTAPKRARRRPAAD